MNKARIYWICQLSGWSIFVLLNWAFLYLNDAVSDQILLGLVSVFFSGVILTQLFRFVVIRYHWLKLSPLQAFPRVFISNIAMGAMVTLIQFILGSESEPDSSTFNSLKFGLNTLNFSFVFLFWSLIYFLFHFIVNYKKAEIENLKWEAAIKDTELNKLKSQLNPHFMFNAMNSIRALIDENPLRAKEAVTQLAGLLRNTLQMGKFKTIPLAQELDIVRDYLALESARLEERLKIRIEAAENTLKCEVPPLMLQTLAENGIKHGISKIPEGGELCISSERNNGSLILRISNTGFYNETLIPETGFGLKNTQERLQLLYGNGATFSIRNEEPNTVITEITIPQND
ncbi:MAG: histidine kinase [Bacteroidia bacterium]